MVALLAGCHPVDPGAPTDGGAGDGGPQLLTCQAPVGPTWVISSYGLSPVGEGFDLNGDGKIDNILGQLAPFANSYWASSVQSGFSLFLLDFPGLGMPITDATNFPFYFFVGIDVDDPPNTENNLGGNGQFLVPAGQLDVSCNPTAVFGSTVLSNYRLSAKAPHIDIVTAAIGDFISSD